MIEPERILEPVRPDAPAVRGLREYESGDDLAAAVSEAAAAVERSLRLLLRSDVGSADEDRVRALSPEELPFARLIERLRARELISLDLAGRTHELRAAAARVADGSGTPRAGDADDALQTIARLREEVASAPERAAATSSTEETPATPRPRPQATLDTTTAVPLPARRRRAWAAGGILLFLVGVAALVLWLFGGESDREAGMRAFERADYLEASQSFEAAVADHPDDVGTRLYLARTLRRLGRTGEAAAQLRAAARLAPEDADVRRELGHLFMDLGQPAAAVRQYRQAIELDPDANANWLGLLRALAAAHDPDFAQTLRRAPADVRAAVGTARSAAPRPDSQTRAQ